MATTAVTLLLCITFLASLVAAIPVRPPNLWNCKPITLHQWTFDCCLPTENIKIKDFEFPDQNEPMRVRRSSSFLDEETKEKLNLAYERMRALPADDPRSMSVQQNIHCAYCAGVYTQQNSSKIIDIHANWLVHPFHRMYVYFHERILATLIDDPTLTIPFWNWDNQSMVHNPFPNSFPEYMTTKPALKDARRDPRHMPPAIADLSWRPSNPAHMVPKNSTDEEMRVYNMNWMHLSMVKASALPNMLIGVPYRFDEEAPFGPGLLELGPHSSIHTWVGDYFNDWPQAADLAPATTAARDPIFYQHHCNVDRLITEWEKMGGRRRYSTDRDFLDASFYFYDEMGDLVRVTVEQALQMEKLRYEYEPIKNAWLKDPSIRISPSDPSTPVRSSYSSRALSSVLSWLGYPSTSGYAMQSDIPAVESLKLVRISSSPFHSRVSRPHAGLRAAGKVDELEEVLSIKGIWIPSRQPVYFDIFINLPDANDQTPIYAMEWLGTFNNGPHMDRAEFLDHKLSFSVTIGEKMKTLNLVDRTDIVVSLVPQGDFKHEREVEIDTITLTLQ